jgi:hypothetical protein
MSGPAKEGARQCASFKAVGTAPSINLTPVGDKSIPLPYTTYQDLSNSVAVVPNVLLNGKPAYVLEQSIQPSCEGDELGTDKGVKSETVGGYVKPTQSSGTVTMMGMLAVRVGDACMMNGGNNPGIYTCEAPAAPNPAKSAAQTSDPDLEVDTPQEQSSVSQWLEETSNDLSEWWEQTKSEMGEALDNPWEGAKGAGKSAINTVPETGEMVMQAPFLQQANYFDAVSTLLDLCGQSEAAQGARMISQWFGGAADSIDTPKLEMNNDAQAGGGKMFSGATAITGVIGVVKSSPKLLARLNAKTAKEADEALEAATDTTKDIKPAAGSGEVASPGDGVVVKPAKAEMESGGGAVPRKVDPKTLQSRQGRREMTPRKTRKFTKKMQQDGYSDFPEIDAYDVDGELIIKDGHHRARAAVNAGITEVPINRIPVTDEAMKQTLRNQAFDAKLN